MNGFYYFLNVIKRLMLFFLNMMILLLMLSQNAKNCFRINILLSFQYERGNENVR